MHKQESCNNRLSEPRRELVLAIRAQRDRLLAYDGAHGHAPLAEDMHAAVGHQVVHRRPRRFVWRRIVHGADDPLRSAGQLLGIDLEEPQLRAILEEELRNHWCRGPITQVHEAICVVE